jgi:hypothetical protein
MPGIPGTAQFSRLMSRPAWRARQRQRKAAQGSVLSGFGGFSFHQTFPVGLAPVPEIQKVVIATELRARKEKRILAPSATTIFAGAD